MATARYVADQLRKHFPKATVESVTGEAYTRRRRLKWTKMGEDSEANTGRILVATDCLLKVSTYSTFYGLLVVHYDLAWNPTRHEQREGRVDRQPTGQRSTLYHALWSR